jgi:hypothetical protein
LAPATSPTVTSNTGPKAGPGDRGQSCFIRGDNSLKLAGPGTRNFNRIHIAGLRIHDARIDFGPGAVGKTLAELRS